MLTAEHLIIGRIALQTEGGLITRLFLPCEAPPVPAAQADPLAEETFRQLIEYLAGQRRTFDLPLAPPGGTPLQRRIMERLSAIPYGRTVTYSSLGPARLVGHLCATNPLPLLRPCHRVIPVKNPPGNYRGGAGLKQFLLTLEQSNCAPAAVTQM